MRKIKECPLVLNCANEVSMALFSGCSICAVTKSALVEYKLFMRTVSFALNNALLLITLPQNSWTTLRSLKIYLKNYLAQTGLVFTARLYPNYIFLYNNTYVVKDTDNSSGRCAASCLELHQRHLHASFLESRNKGIQYSWTKNPQNLDLTPSCKFQSQILFTWAT